MEKGVIIVALGIIAFLSFAVLNRKQKNLSNVYPDVLSDEKYKVKGQWDK